MNKKLLKKRLAYVLAVGIAANATSQVIAKEAYAYGVDQKDAVLTVEEADLKANGSDYAQNKDVSEAYVKISDIQGKAHTSIFNNKHVIGVQGIVTAIDKMEGFYMQDPNPDNDPATSEGIYVKAPNHNLTVGTAVKVDGIVEEGIGYTTNPNSNEAIQLTVTQIKASEIEVVQTDVALPKATIIGANGRMPEVKDIIDNDNFANFDPEEDFIDFYESLEGMLVQVQDAQVVGGAKYHEIPVVPDRGIHSSNGLSPNGGVVISEGTMHPEIIHLAKGMNTTQPTVMVGDVFAGNIEGILTYNDGNYKLAVSEELPSLEQHHYDADKATTLQETENGLRIASFNVENLGGDAKPEKVADIAEVIVDKLLCPDIIGLQEVQDNSGRADDGTVAADKVYNNIIEAIKAINPEVTYAYTEIAPEDGQDGGMPGGNIRVGMLYRTDRVQMVEKEAGKANEAVQVVKDNKDGSASLTLNPGRIDPQNAAFDSTRRSLAVEFLFKGEKVIVINNHLSSKGGDDPLFGNVQPPVLVTETERIQQAQVINNFVKDILAVDSDAKVVLLGDMNDYYFSKALRTLEGKELYNMHESLKETERYTYSYQGKSQVLDNILVTAGLEEQTELEILHMNSTRGKYEQLTDHDPMIIRINMDEKESETIKPTVHFTDITNHWAKDDILYLASKGYVVGTAPGLYTPNAGMKAIDLKTLLGRIIKEEVSIGELPAGQIVTRAQVAVIVKESLAKDVKVDTTKLRTQFNDIKGLSDKEVEALAYLYNEGVLKGISTNQMAPNMTFTRAQAATVIARLLKK